MIICPLTAGPELGAELRQLSTVGKLSWNIPEQNVEFDSSRFYHHQIAHVYQILNILHMARLDFSPENLVFLWLLGVTSSCNRRSCFGLLSFFSKLLFQ